MGFSLYRDDNELEELWEKHSAFIFPVCVSYFSDTKSAEAALIRIFINLMKYEHDFENEESVRLWLLKNADNVCINMLHNWWRDDLKKPENELSFEDNYDNESFGEEYNDTTSEDEPDYLICPPIMQAVRKSPSDTKLMLYFSCHEGLSSADISKLLDISINTVRSRLHASLKFIKSEFLNNETGNSFADSEIKNTISKAYDSITLPKERSSHLFETCISKAYDEEFNSNIIPKEDPEDKKTYNLPAVLPADFDDRANSIALIKETLPKLIPGFICIIFIIAVMIWYFINN